MTIRYITPLIAVAATAATGLAQSEPFQWDTRVDYTTRETDVDDIELNEDNFSVGAKFYFQEVTDNRVPNREMAFASKASWIGFGVDIQQVDDDIDNVVDIDSYSFATRLISADYGWYGEFGYVDTDSGVSGSDPDGVLRFQPKYDGFALELGKYIAENTTVGVSYSEIDYESLRSNSTFESGSDTIGVTFRHYSRITEESGFAIEGNYYWLDLQVADFDALDDDPLDSSGEVYSLTATFYPTNEIGIGLGYADADDLGGRPYLNSKTALYDGAALFAEWFITTQFSVRAMYSNSEYDLSDADDIAEPGEVDSDSLTFGATFRF